MKVWMFPGQGSQRVGMGKTLYERYDWVRDLYHKAEEILGLPLREVSFEGPEERLTQTLFAQPALFVYEAALAQHLEEQGESPDLVMGHSLGEFVALYVAGIWDFETAIKIVGERARLMQKASEEAAGTMAAVIGLTPEEIETVLEEVPGTVVVANLNSPEQVVISGEIPAVRETMDRLKAQGARRVIPLRVSAAFHSPLMEPAAKAFEKVLENAVYHEPRVPVICNATAKATRDLNEICEALKQQLRSPVRWVESLQEAYRWGGRVFVEVGPGRVLQGLARRTLKDIDVQGVEE